MNNSIPEIEVVSSELGNRWLAQMKAAAPDVFVDSTARSIGLPEVVFDQSHAVNSSTEQHCTCCNKTMALEDVCESEPDSSVQSESDSSVQSTPQTGSSQNVELETPDLAVDNEESADTIVADAEIDCVAEQILERFNGESNVVVVVSGCQKGIATGETCTRIAGALAQRNQGSVLLVDSEVDGKTMTHQCGLQDEEGLANFLSGDGDWENSLFNQDELPLSFLSAGNVDLQVGQRAKNNIKRLVKEARDQFRFVCVTTGDAHNEGVDLWMSSCSGSYLVVDMQQSNKTIARSAVQTFQNAGAEVLGCLVTNSG